MTAGEPCEGGCGCRVGTDDPIGRSVEGYAFELGEARIPTYVATHTPGRCRTIRVLRETTAARLPDATVTVGLRGPHHHALAVRASRRRSDGLVVVADCVVSLALTADPRYVDDLAPYVAEHIARGLDAPEGDPDGVLGGYTVIARDPRPGGNATASGPVSSPYAGHHPPPPRSSP